MGQQKETPCPCGSGKGYALCCGRYHGETNAPTAEALMRSRYSAYTMARAHYLLDTWHASTRPDELDLENERSTRWIGLDIKRCEQTGPESATVEFVARYKIAGRAYRLHEISRFVREEGRWYYVDGTFPEQD